MQCGGLGFDPWVREDSLEKEMATHSTILAWEIQWTEMTEQLILSYPLFMLSIKKKVLCGERIAQRQVVEVGQ